MIYHPYKNQLILFALNLTDQRAFIKFYDGETLNELYTWGFHYNMTYIQELYFIDSETLIIQDASGIKYGLNTTNNHEDLIFQSKFPAIYLDPFWYSQPTSDTLFVYYKLGNHYLFNLGQEVAYMGQSGENLIMVTPSF